MLDLSPWTEVPWLAEPNRLRQLAAKVIAMRPCPTAREVAAERGRRLDEARQLAAKSVRAVKGKVGVLPIIGPIEQHLSGIGMKAGAVFCDEISMGLDALLSAKDVDAIVMLFDSPGGSSYGIEELGDKIYAARGKKPLYGIADSMACSAAYWLMSACDIVCCTPGGDVGSVGVYVMHVDQSAAAEREGVKVSFVSAGKYKTEGNPFEPLSEDARLNLQEQVDWTMGKFQNALKRHRNTSIDDVRKNYGQGRVLNADQALAAGMIDRVVSFEALIQKLTGSSGNPSAVRAVSAEVLRLRHEHRKRASRLQPMEMAGGNPYEIRVGDMVEWMREDPDGKCAYLEDGMVEEIMDDGPLGIPGTSLTLKGTKADPAARMCHEGESWHLEPLSRLHKAGAMREEEENGHGGMMRAATRRRLGPGLSHDSKLADSEPDWASVDKTRLPRVAFADRENRSYPHHWVQNGSEPDDEGRYTKGTLWLHKQGLNAAWAAANGARSGEQASQAVKSHLQAHRRALGMED